MRKTLVLIVAVFVIGQNVHNQPGPDWVRHVIAEGFSTQTVVAADFTGHGRVDVITGDITPGQEKTVLYVAPDWKPIVLRSGIRTIYGVALDVNGDGKLDLVASRYHPGLVYWLERPQDPLHEAWPYHVVDDAAQGGIDGVHGLWAGDVDRDGKPDLIASSGQPTGAFPDSLAWFRIPPNPGTALRWERYVIANGDAPGLSHYIGFGDVNGDGRPDVASAAKDSAGGNWFAWWEQGQDPRKSWKKHLIAENQFGATNILISDLNGDGKPDFVASRGHGSGITWYEAPAWTPHDISTEIKGPHSLAVGDINGDGKPDVVTVAKDSRIAAWFENDGKGHFNEHRIGDNQSAYDIRLVDMDGDGDLDVLVAGFESKNVVWYENRLAKPKLLQADLCGELTKLTFADAKVTSTQNVEQDHSVICKVNAILTPTPESQVNVELWLPKDYWNGKYMAVGNGGWSGSINYMGLADGTRRGYATSSTDTGHAGGSASFALGHPEKLIDYAYRSEHEMAVKAKAIIAAYYGKPARLSYWNGCSAGGKQGLKEAQQYPADFDGIVAGAPASNWTGRAAQAIWSAQAVHMNEASYIPPAKYPLLHNAVLAACDALDGVPDGVLENPKKCGFDPKVLECKGTDGQECLSSPQVEAARKLYSDSVNPRTGQHLYPGLQKGSELGWATWAGPRPLAIALDYFRYIVFRDPDWDFRTLNFDADIAKAEQMDARRINATDPNLKPFFDHGGKLIQYHGWSDPQISPGNSLSYYQSVKNRLGSTIDSSYRLFMVPGMSHCGGGEGTDSFDMVNALEQWVEAKKAPARIVAARVRKGKTERTRPLCPFPQIAVYEGHGSTDDEENFACKMVP